jgi:hypothetical protein
MVSRQVSIGMSYDVVVSVEDSALVRQNWAEFCHSTKGDNCLLACSALTSAGVHTFLPHRSDLSITTLSSLGVLAPLFEYCLFNTTRSNELGCQLLAENVKM